MLVNIAGFDFFGAGIAKNTTKVTKTSVLCKITVFYTLNVCFLLPI